MNNHNEFQITELNFNVTEYAKGKVFNVLRTIKMSSFKRKVTVSGDLMFLESCGHYDVKNTVTLFSWRHKTISHYDFW